MPVCSELLTGLATRGALDCQRSIDEPVRYVEVITCSFDKSVAKDDVERPQWFLSKLATSSSMSTGLTGVPTPCQPVLRMNCGQ
jgi:hypothetical protein